MARAGSWKNEAHVDLLRELHREGLSGSQIADRLNKSFKDAEYSRNAVIGKMHRLGLVTSPEARHATNVFKNRQNTRGKQSVELRAPEVARKLAAKPLLIIGNGAVVPAAEAQPSRFIPGDVWKPLEGSEPVSLIHLGQRMCKWPVEVAGAAEQMFCGCRTASRYCLVHEEAERERAKAQNSQPLTLSPKAAVRLERRAA